MEDPFHSIYDHERRSNEAHNHDNIFERKVKHNIIKNRGMVNANAHGNEKSSSAHGHLPSKSLLTQVFEESPSTSHTTNFPPTTISVYSAADLTFMFGSACPSFNDDLDTTHFPSRLSATPTNEIPLVKTLQAILPFRSQNGPWSLQHDWIRGNNKMGYATGVVSVWIVVSLLLGLWFLFLRFIAGNGMRNDTETGQQPGRKQKFFKFKYPCRKYWRYDSKRILEAWKFFTRSRTNPLQRHVLHHERNVNDTNNGASADGYNDDESCAKCGDVNYCQGNDGIEAISAAIGMEDTAAISWSLLMKASSDACSISEDNDKDSEKTKRFLSKCDKIIIRSECNGNIDGYDNSNSADEKIEQSISIPFVGDVVHDYCHNGTSRDSDSEWSKTHQVEPGEQSLQEKEDLQSSRSIPILPSMSDLSIPPGLSESISSPSSSCNTYDVAGGDNDSIAVLATDDIYTGNAGDRSRQATTTTNTEVGNWTPAAKTASYLSYCLSEGETPGVERKNQFHKRSSLLEDRNNDKSLDGGNESSSSSLLLSLVSKSSIGSASRASARFQTRMSPQGVSIEGNILGGEIRGEHSETNLGDENEPSSNDHHSEHHHSQGPLLSRRLFDEDSKGNPTIDLLGDGQRRGRTKPKGENGEDIICIQVPSSPYGINGGRNARKNNDLSPRTCSPSKRMKRSNFSSDALAKKRRLEDFVKSWKESSISNSNVRRLQLEEFIKSSEATNANTSSNNGSVTSGTPNTAKPGIDSNRHPVPSTDIYEEERINRRSVLPTEDPFEPVQFQSEETQEKNDTNAVLLSDQSGSSDSSFLRLVTRGLVDEREQLISPLSFTEDFDGRQIIKDRGVGRQAYCDMSLRARQWIVGIACIILVTSAALYVSKGATKMHRVMQSIDHQWENLKIGTIISLNDTRSISETLDRKVQRFHQLFPNHCPEASPSLCNSSYLSSTTCDLNDLPLRHAWSDWFEAANGASVPVGSSRIVDDFDSSGFDSSRYGRFWQWLDTTHDGALNFFSDHDEGIQNGLKICKWTLWMAASANLLLGLLAVGIIFRMLCPIALAWIANLTITGERCRIDVPRTETPSLENQRRIITIVFWALVFSSWTFGFGLSIAAALSVDLCGTENPNGVALDLLDLWEEANGNVDGTDPSLLEVWQQCLSTHTLMPPSVVGNSIDDLSNLANRIQTLADGLDAFSSSGLYENICGQGILPIVQLSQDVNAQICHEAQIVAKTYIEFTSCEKIPSMHTYNSMFDDAICRQGLQGLTWATVAQVIVLISAFVAWSFRAIFVSPPVLPANLSETDEDPDGEAGSVHSGIELDSITLLFEI